MASSPSIRPRSFVFLAFAAGAIGSPRPRRLPRCSPPSSTGTDAGGVIRVERSWDVKEGAVEPKSNAGTRPVPIASVLRDYLIEHKLRSGRSEGLVFGRSQARPFNHSSIVRRAEVARRHARTERAAELTRADGLELDQLTEADRDRYLDRAGFEPIALHECRHTFASLMIDAGVNAKALSTYMGHSSITITLDRYGHLFPGNILRRRRGNEVGATPHPAFTRGVGLLLSSFDSVAHVAIS
jgi:integrase